jgi:predicted ATPase
LIDLGLPAAGTTAFQLDPVVKQECVWHGPLPRPSTILAERRGPVVRLRTQADGWNVVTEALSPFDTMMMQVADPRNAPEMLTLRESIRAWRFYDHFRTDSDAPARSPQIGTYTPVLCDDGSDIAAAIETIRKFGDGEALNSTVDDAFPGSHLSIEENSGRFALLMKQHGLLRPLGAAELSDGTLRYILWIAALLTPRPPALMVLNEPETSLHPSLLSALARLVGRAAAKSHCCDACIAADNRAEKRSGLSLRDARKKLRRDNDTRREANESSDLALACTLRIMRSLVFAPMPGTY